MALAMRHGETCYLCRTGTASRTTRHEHTSNYRAGYLAGADYRRRGMGVGWRTAERRGSDYAAGYDDGYSLALT